jgi:hypothetical protein
MEKHDVSLFARELVESIDVGDALPSTAAPITLRLFERLIEQTRQLGVALEQVWGPWHVAAFVAPFVLPLGAARWPVVACGAFSLSVPDEQAAEALAGFLNWCGIGAPTR